MAALFVRNSNFQLIWKLIFLSQTTNSCPHAEQKKKANGKIATLDIAPTIAEAIRRTHNGESISFLFDNVPM